MSMVAEAVAAGQPDATVRADAGVSIDLLEAVGVEVPCVVCHGAYRVSLRTIRLGQLMMDAGCDARHFADCPPAAFAHLIDPRVLAEFETAVRRLEPGSYAALPRS